MHVIVWVIALYLLTDFFDPARPGAFSFNPDASVEVVRVQTAPLTASSGSAMAHVLRGAAAREMVVLVDDRSAGTHPRVLRIITFAHEPRRGVSSRSTPSASEEVAPASLAA